MYYTKELTLGMIVNFFTHFSLKNNQSTTVVVRCKRQTGPREGEGQRRWRNCVARQLFTFQMTLLYKGL